MTADLKRHLPSLFRTVLAAGLLVAASWPTAKAGPLEDAQAADERRDYATELRLIRALADAGSARAQYMLGRMYDDGTKGVSQSNLEAIKWYRLASVQGDAQAQISLGAMYASARGVQQDYVEAAKWFRLAAEQGNAIAQVDLGSMYDLGKGVPQDYAEAVRWYRLAAAQGSASAQLALGEQYELGHGVPQDFVMAHMWYNLATAHAPDPRSWLLTEATNRRDRLVNQMTPAQIAEAQKLARDWKPTLSAQQAAVAPEAHPQSPPAPEISSGSGFIVSENGDVLTNAHVVEGCKNAEVTVRDKTTTASIVARDQRIDLALLKVPQRPPSVALLRLMVRQGESIFAYGFPLPGLLSSGGNFTSGAVTALAGIRDDSRHLQISAPVQPGNSGGPLLDEAGNVVGIVVAKLDALKVARVTDDVPQNVNFAIKATVAADFLAAHGVHFTEIGLIGPPLSPSDIAERARAFTTHIECEQETTGAPLGAGVGGR